MHVLLRKGDTMFEFSLVVLGLFFALGGWLSARICGQGCSELE
ncbi:MAG: hypothetical protein JWN01_1040 [Patescibacteria group bacterium]|nr:hypothetical protein [Patescibacteria group bacterium]